MDRVLSAPHLRDRRRHRWLPWRLRCAGRCAAGSLAVQVRRVLRCCGLALDRDVDRPRSWDAPDLSLCQPAAPFRSVFRRSEFNSPQIQALRMSLLDCARITATTLEPSKHWEIPVLLSGSALRRGDRCLDVGCGSSCLPVWLDGVGCEVFAVDPEMSAVSSTWTMPTRRIHVNNGFINYTRGSVGELPYRDAFFDHVFCVSVLEHLPPAALASAVLELQRVLRPGGTLAISTDLYPTTSGRLTKQHARIFNLQDLEESLLKPLFGLKPVAPIDVSIEEGLDQHLRDVHEVFGARHSFFAAVWRKPPAEHSAPAQSASTSAAPTS